MTYNDNVSTEFADLIRKMLSKKPENRPASMWEFLKVFRGMRLFKKQPRQPDVSVFDIAAGLKTPDDLLKHDDPLKPKSKPNDDQTGT
ncbi:MAG: hypothetical protein R3C05_13985 [Pirellulaceae bacterium]